MADNKPRNFSVSQSRSTAIAAHGKGWRVCQVGSLTLSNAILNGIWSPIVWRNGHRTEDNFESADLAVFDFDEGPTIAGIAGSLSISGFKYIIATTRHHQLPKETSRGVKPACDRFRLVMAFDRAITDLRQFRYNMMQYAKLFESDKSCVDGARMYFPSLEIVRTDDGESLDVLDAPEDFEDCGHLVERIVEQKVSGKLSANAARFLKYGRAFGEGRNVSVYVTSMELFALGFDFDRARDMILNSPFDRQGFDDRELITTIESALRKFVALAKVDVP